MSEEFEKILDAVGSFHSYQKWMIAVVIAPTSFAVAFMMSGIIFQTLVPAHWCHVPGRENTSYTVDQWKTLTIPADGGRFSECEKYKMDWTGDEDQPYRISNDTEECNAGWDFDPSEMAATIATSYDWFCERRRYSDHILAVGTAGNAVGTLILPFLSDRFLGRRLAFYLSHILFLVFTLAFVWTPTYTFQLIFRFMAALSFLTNYQMPYIITLEFLPPSRRGLGVLVSFVAWTLGLCFTSLVAWLMPRWDHLALATCIPPVLFFFYLLCLPESPRWLLMCGKVKECAAVLIQVAKYNKKDPPSAAELEVELQELRKNHPKEESLLKVMSYPKLRQRAILLFFISTCTYMMYGILIFSINVLNNYFLSHLVLSASELPSNILGWIFSDYFGRRFTCIFSFIVAAVFSLAAPFTFHNEWAHLVVVAFIKLFVTQLIFSLFLLSAEIFPTPVRSTGFAWLLVSGFAAMSAAPYILSSGLSPAFPYWVMLVLLLLCCLAALPLPETLGLPLPSTFQEAENLDSGRPVMTWIHYWNYKKYSVPSASSDAPVPSKKPRCDGDLVTEESKMI
ncbi:beta-alanine transporter-like [Penaeus japonicus]|uniref:beta-alanine transporter-like n=1 Tax=Penaeus japonicus TaxID=27405 RepID=UPI001C70B273|nr:beta-alanine transporter-like [Penaeus japonicus]